MFRTFNGLESLAMAVTLTTSSTVNICEHFSVFFLIFTSSVIFSDEIPNMFMLFLYPYHATSIIKNGLVKF